MKKKLRLLFSSYQKGSHSKSSFGDSGQSLGKSCIRFFFTGIMVFIFLPRNYSQGNSARITILAGGSVSFVFNSIEEYRNGITYTNWTTFEIEVVELAPLPAIVSWTLDVEALSATIAGTPPNTLPLSTLRLNATAFPSGCAGCVSTGIQTLPPFGTKADLVTGGPLGAPPPSNQVSISYSCGTLVPLLGASPVSDYYTVDLQFTVKPCAAGPVCFDP